MGRFCHKVIIVIKYALHRDNLVPDLSVYLAMVYNSQVIQSTIQISNPWYRERLGNCLCTSCKTLLMISCIYFCDIEDNVSWEKYELTLYLGHWSTFGPGEGYITVASISHEIQWIDQGQKWVRLVFENVLILYPGRWEVRTSLIFTSLHPYKTPFALIPGFLRCTQSAPLINLGTPSALPNNNPDQTKVRPGKSFSDTP